LATNQSCFNTGQFTFTETQRQCVTFDSSGSNSCIKPDGSTAAVNEIDSVTTPCSTIPNCFSGTWKACVDETANVQDCGAPASGCGTVVPANTGTTSICQELISGVLTTVPNSNCDPSLQPPDCTANTCFNFPCIAYIAGYSNISSILSSSDTTVYFELMDNTSMFICQANYTVSQSAAANTPSDVLGSGPVTTVFSAYNAGDILDLRFNVIPSPANAATGGFYLFATLPGNAQVGIVSWDATNLWLVVNELALPSTLGQSLDDVLPQPQLFAITGTSPYVLNTQTGGINTSIITNLVFNVCSCACGACNGACNVSCGLPPCTGSCIETSQGTCVQPFTCPNV
jgi:hypothetical protein